MRLKIASLKLSNFKGIRFFELDLDGTNAVIYGDNSTGKTSLFDAVTWLLLDKDSTNRKDFDIKTLDEEGNPLHGLQHEVEAALLVDGKELTLRKAYMEKWTKKRGSADKQFTGHTTEHHINGVPVKKGEYDARIAELADEKVFRLLTDPTCFNEHQHWEERREILLDVSGGVSQDEVIAADESLAKLPDILGDRSIEDHRKVILSKRKEINKDLDRIPVRIDEVQRHLPDTADLDEKTLQSQIKHLKAQKREKEGELLRVESGGQAAELTKQLREIEAKLIAFKNAYHEKTDKRVYELKEEKQEVLDRIRRLKSDLRRHTEDIEDNKKMIGRWEKQVQDLRDKWHEVNSEEFTYEDSTTTCPTCGQALPEEQVVQAREIALADFNRNKAQKLEKITAEGKDCKREIEMRNAKNEELQQSITKLEAQLDSAEKDSDHIQSRIDKLIADVTPLEESSEYKTLTRQKEKLEKKVKALFEDNTDAFKQIKVEITSIEDEISSVQSSLSTIKSNRQGQTRIEELKVQERELAAEYERLESELYMIETYVRKQADLLEKKINSHFELANFKLFKEQINGGLEECCECLYKGVPYSTALNKGAQINVGLDIINTLSKYYNFYPPVWIDGCESVTKTVATESQMIKLVVSEKDKQLRVEVEAQQKKQSEVA